MPGNIATQWGGCVSLVFVVLGITTIYWGLPLVFVFWVDEAGGQTGRMKAFHPHDGLDLTDNIPTQGTHQPREDHPSQQG